MLPVVVTVVCWCQMPMSVVGWLTDVVVVKFVGQRPTKCCCDADAPAKLIATALDGADGRYERWWQLMVVIEKWMDGFANYSICRTVIGWC